MLGPTAMWSAGVVLVVSTVLDLAEVERQLDLSSVAVRLRALGSCPTKPVTCEAHPFFFQVKESRRVPIPLLVLVSTIVELGLRHQQSNTFTCGASGVQTFFLQKMCRHTHQWCRHNNTDSKAKCVKMLRLCRHQSRVCRHELQFFRNKCTQVDTLSEQVDTLSEQVDTGPSSQNISSHIWDSVSTPPPGQVDTLRKKPLKHPKEADPVEAFVGEEFKEDPTSEIAEHRLGLQAMASRGRRDAQARDDEQRREERGEQQAPAPQGPTVLPPPPPVDYDVFMQGLVQAMQTQAQTQAALQVQLQAQAQAPARGVNEPSRAE
ncbi:hypothetical protein Taro_005280 [Colocasia esculenta]|uniref:Uncharacterized protein n=1 Tax=Colocasia esculenta TaxID=4460 RepID=A0A843TU77_COLES|nr:hypothetical protein [Colocasia esculenta]